MVAMGNAAGWLIDKGVLYCGSARIELNYFSSWYEQHHAECICVVNMTQLLHWIREICEISGEVKTLTSQREKDSEFRYKLDALIRIAITESYGLPLECFDLEGSELLGANLTIAKLNGANLSNSILGKAILFGANLIGANLRGAYLVDADLSSANLSDADLSSADLSDANLMNADLRNVNLHDVTLIGTNLNNVKITNKMIASDRESFLQFYAAKFDNIWVEDDVIKDILFHSYAKNEFISAFFQAFL